MLRHQNTNAWENLVLHWWVVFTALDKFIFICLHSKEEKKVLEFKDCICLCKNISSYCSQEECSIGLQNIEVWLWPLNYDVVKNHYKTNRNASPLRRLLNSSFGGLHPSAAAEEPFSLQPDKQTDGLTDWRTDGLTDWRTGGLTDWQTDGLTNGQTDNGLDNSIIIKYSQL